MLYVIMDRNSDVWNASLGWGPARLGNATLFNKDEKESFTLPDGGRWVEHECDVDVTHDEVHDEWITLTPDNDREEYASEDEACAFQRGWRAAVLYLTGVDIVTGEVHRDR